MKPKFITLNYWESGSKINYTVSAEQIASFSWEPWNCATCVTMKNGVVVYVENTPAQIAKKIQAACTGKEVFQ